MPTRCAVYKGDAMTQTTPPMPVGENERIHALDALRGIALLGILTVNMGSFKGLSTLEMFPSAESLAQSANRTAFLLINTLFTGKFYPIFAFLFGLGFALQIERLQARGVNPTGIMLRRLGVLLLIGVLLVCSEAVQRPLVPIAAAGRMALTNYLMQSVVCTLLFYGYGLGLHDRVGIAQGMGVAAILWGVQVVVSALWLRWFQYGPMEWLWRSLTYGQRMPLRRKAQI